MPAMNTTVKHFTNHMTNSGSFLANLTNAAGTLITVLDACLVNGFGTVTPTDITVSSGVATATFSAAHPFAADTVAAITGATPSGLNGEHKVISTTSTTVTFDAFDVADGTATGTISMKLAPLGWEKTYSGTNKAVYRQTDVTGTRFYLRIDDTYGNYARVRAYESMTTVDAGTNPFPRVEQEADSELNWNKSSGSASRWWIVGNGKLFHLGIRGYNDTNNTNGVNWLFTFGDIEALKSDDAYRCIFTSTTTASASEPYFQHNPMYFNYSTTYINRYFARNINQLGLPAFVYYFGFGIANNEGRMPGDYPYVAFPNIPDSGIHVFPIGITDPQCHRGWMPGMYHSQNQMNLGNIYDNTYINTFVNFNRKMLLKNLNSGTYYGSVIFDVTGPWNN